MVIKTYLTTSSDTSDSCDSRVISYEKPEKNTTNFFGGFFTWKVKSISSFSNKNTLLDFFGDFGPWTLKEISNVVNLLKWGFQNNV